MNIVGIDHIAVATEDVDETASLFERLLGIEFGDRIKYTTQTDTGNHEFVGRLSNGPEGFDLVQPSDENPVRDFLDEYGPGTYAIALQVTDIEEALDELESEGVEPVGSVSPGEFTEYFFHPDDFGGMFIILAERPHPFETNRKFEGEQGTNLDED